MNISSQIPFFTSTSFTLFQQESSKTLQSFLCSTDNLLPLALEVSIDLVHEDFSAEIVSALLNLVAVNADCEILGHVAGLDSVNNGGLESLGELAQELVVVQLCSVAETSGPGEDGGDWVGGSGLSLLPLSVVACHGTVSSLRLNDVVLIEEN